MPEQTPDGLSEDFKLPTRREYVQQKDFENAQTFQRSQDKYRRVQTEGVNYAPAEFGGLNFERYYNRDSYKKLGFNPFADNEKLMNAHGNETSDWSEAGKGFWELADLGFNSIWSGKTSSEKARRYASAANRYSSTKGGWTGRMANAKLNSGYTIGLLSEIALEEVGMGIATFFTGGGAGPAAAARTATNMGRLAKGGISAAKMGSNLTSTFKRLKDLKKAATAKNFYKAAGSVVNAVNPLRGTTQFLKEGARQYKKSRVTGRTERLSNLAIASRGFGTFYRDIREVNLAFDEAKLESGFVLNKTVDDLIREHIKNNNEHPDEEQIKKMTEVARRGANRALLTNTGIIYATNRIAFGNVFNKWMPRALSKTGRKIVGGRYVKNFKTGKMEFIKHGGVLGHKTLINEAKYAFKASTLKKLPFEGVKFLGRYSRANVGEGIQEYFQEVIQHAEVGMAKDIYYGALQGAAWDKVIQDEDYVERYKESLSHYISEEGREVFLSGFMMGMFAGPFSRGSQSLTKHLGQGGRRVFDSKAFKKEQDIVKNTQEEIDKNVEKFNKLTSDEKSFIKDYVRYLAKQASYKEGMETAQEDDDIKASKDIKDHALVEHILFAQSMGGYDLVLQKMKDMADLSEEDLENAYGGVVEGDETLHKDYKQSYDKVIERAERIKDLSDQFDELFPDPGQHGEDDSDLKTGKQLQDVRRARQRAKAFIILNQNSALRTMERMESISKELYGEKAPFWKKDKTPPASEITRINNVQNIDDELVILKNQIKALKGFDKLDDTQKKDLKSKERLVENLVNMRNAMSDFVWILRASKGLNLEQEQTQGLEDLGENSVISYRRGDVEWDGIIVGETTDKKGRPQWLVKKSSKPDAKPTKILKTSTGIFDKKSKMQPLLDKLKKNEEKVEAKLKSEFRTYMEFIAKENNNKIDPAKIDAAYESYKDLQILSRDEENLTELVSMLLDPKGYVALVSEYNKAIKQENDDEVEILAEQFKLFYETEQAKELVQDLVDNYGVFIIQDDLEALLTDNIVPREVYDTLTTIPLRNESTRHKEALEAIEKWQLATGRVEKEEIEEEEEIPVEEIPVEKEVVVLTRDNLDKWPQEIITQAEAIMETTNATMQENDLPTPFEELGPWLQQGPGKHNGKISSLLANYNSTIKKDKAPPKKDASTDPPKKPTQASEIEAKKDDIERRRQKELNFKIEENTVSAKSPALWGSYDEIRSSIRNDFKGNPNLTTKSYLEAAKRQVSRYDISKIKEWENAFKDEINTKYDAEYVDAVKKGEITKEQAMQVLEEIGRKDSEAYAELAALEKPAQQPPTASKTRSINFNISEDSKVKMASEESEIVTMPAKVSIIDELEKELRTVQILGKNESLNDAAGKSFSIDILNSDGAPVNVMLSIEGLLPRKDSGTIDEVATRLGLPQKEEGEHIHPVKSTETQITYYSTNETEVNWLKGNGQMYMFSIQLVTPIEDTGESDVEDLNKWKTQVENRLKKKKTKATIEKEHTAIVKENGNRSRDNKLSADELQKYLDDALTGVKNKTVTTSDFINGQSYKLKGKLSKFGDGVVSKINDGKSVEFMPTIGEETITVEQKDLKGLIGDMVDIDINENISEEGIEVTEKEIIKKSVKVNKEITGAEVTAMADQLSKSNKTVAELKAEQRKKNKIKNKKCKK
jgi:predicted secreted protein